MSKNKKQEPSKVYPLEEDEWDEYKINKNICNSYPKPELRLAYYPNGLSQIEARNDARWGKGTGWVVAKVLERPTVIQVSPSDARYGVQVKDQPEWLTREVGNLRYINAKSKKEAAQKYIDMSDRHLIGKTIQVYLVGLWHLRDGYNHIRITEFEVGYTT